MDKKLIKIHFYQIGLTNNGVTTQKPLYSNWLIQTQHMLLRTGEDNVKLVLESTR